MKVAELREALASLPDDLDVRMDGPALRHDADWGYADGAAVTYIDRGGIKVVVIFDRQSRIER